MHIDQQLVVDPFVRYVPRFVAQLLVDTDQQFDETKSNILYDFKSDGNLTVAKDLFRKVSTWTYLQEGITGYSYYRIVDGERPDVTAARLYGDSTLYWTFFLVNENLQDFNDWPMGAFHFNRFIDRKYSGTCLLASASTDIVSSTSKFTLGEKVSQSSSIYGFVTEINPTHNRITLNDVKGSFTTGGTATGATSTKSFTISSITDEQDAVNHQTDSNGFKLTVSEFTAPTTGVGAMLYTSSDNTVVTNLEHERNLNEDKHLIRYIEPAFIGRVVDEFVSLVSS